MAENNVAPAGFTTPEEFAKTIGAKPERVRTWIREERLPAVRLGHLVLVPTDALQRLLDRKEGEQ